MLWRSQLERNSVVASRARRFWCGISYLSIQILGCSRCLIYNAFCLGLGIAGSASEPFLYFAADIPDAAFCAILIHAAFSGWSERNSAIKDKVPPNWESKRVSPASSSPEATA